MRPTVSFVVAVYNEEPNTLSLLLQQISAVMASEDLSFEVIFVNDGSGPATSAKLREIALTFEFVKVIELSRNFGQQAAITAGYDHAVGDAVVNLDSDLQDPPAVVAEMLERWRSGYDVVYAQRSSRKDSFAKRFFAFLYYRVLGSVSSVHIPPDTGDFRLLDRKVVDALASLPERSRFIRGLIPWLGFRQIAISIDRNAREAGQSHYTIKKLITLALDGILALSVAPLYVVPIIGTLLFLLGVSAITCWVMFNAHQLKPDFAFIAAVVITVAGLEILCTSAVAVFLTRILNEVRRRPTYLVAHRLGRAYDGPRIVEGENRNLLVR